MVVGIAIAWTLNSTRHGKMLLAVIHDREISGAMGINVDRVYLVTFTVGTMLAAIGGAVTAPTLAVSAGMGVEVIVLSFAVVVIGGLGSLGGAALGALIVGMVRSAAVHYLARGRVVQRVLGDGDGADRAAQGALLDGRGAQDMTDHTVRVLLGVAALLLAGMPFMPQWLMFLITLALAKGLVVLGLVLLMRTGLVSFGQGLYYCLGAYAAALLDHAAGIHDAALMLVAALAVPVAVALVLGLLLASYRGIFFAMLSMAFSMIVFGLLIKTSALGSSDGFNVATRSIFGIAIADGNNGRVFLAATVILSVIAAVALHRYLNSHRGRLSAAVRDNELRVEYLGASVRNVVHLNYVIAAALGGIGGGLTALAVGHIDPDMAYWTTSGEFVFVAVLVRHRQRAGAVLRLGDFRSDPHARQPVRAQYLADDAGHRDARDHHVPAGRAVGVVQAQGAVRMSAILEARGLCKSFGAVIAAADINVSVERDSVTGLIGSNGAGKTTFINMVTGYLKPGTGTIHFDGHDITPLAPRRITQLGIARSFQIPAALQFADGAR